jgi:hypothetical protein
MARYFNPEEYDSEMEAVADGLFAIAAAIKALGSDDKVELMADKLERVADVMEGGFRSMSDSLNDV